MGQNHRASSTLDPPEKVRLCFAKFRELLPSRPAHPELLPAFEHNEAFRLSFPIDLSYVIQIHD
jgi:hypothetical protein